MANISINLLPMEFRQEELKRSKFYKIQFIGISVILATVFLSSLTVALRILQSQNIASAQGEVSTKLQEVEGFKGLQASLFLIQNRVKTLGQYTGIPSRQNLTYQDLNKVLTPSVTLSSLSVDKDGNALIVAAVSDILALDSFLASLIAKEDSKFSEVSIESLSRSRDGAYRASLKLTPK